MKYLKIIGTFLLIFAIYATPGLIWQDRSFYESLNKPSFAFKPYVFQIMWIILFLINALYLTYKLQKKELNKELRASFVMNYFFMLFFNIAFFEFHQLFLGFSLTLLSFSSGIIIFIFLLKENRYEASIITPYLLWTLLATILSGHIYFINP